MRAAGVPAKRLINMQSGAAIGNAATPFSTGDGFCRQLFRMGFLMDRFLYPRLRWMFCGASRRCGSTGSHGNLEETAARAIDAVANTSSHNAKTGATDGAARENATAPEALKRS
ncbi:MAG: hypothetical protein AAGE76_11305 [Pseudomonadota bacterium]